MRRLLAVLAVLCFTAGCGSTTSRTPEGAPLIQRGINLYVTSDPSVDTPNELNARLNQIFAYLHGLNANAVALEFPIYVDGPTGNNVATGPGTPSLEMLRQIIEFASSRNFMVKLRPTIDASNLEGRQPSELEPTNRARWIATYILAIRPFANLARETGVQEFQIGNQLDSLERDPAWEVVRYELKNVYRRALTYTASWERFDDGTAKPPTEAYGMAAYPPFPLPDNASVDDLTAAWNSWFNRVGANYTLRHIVLDEVGIPAAKGMYRAPWTRGDTPGLQYDPAVQVNWFTAVCAAAQKHDITGLYFSRLNLARNPSQRLADGESFDQFIGRPGEVAIRTCFAV